MKSKLSVKRFLIIIFSITFFSVNGQVLSNNDDTTNSHNSVYASFGGGGIYFSVMYEHYIWLKQKYSGGIKAGAGASISPVLFPAEFNIPLGVFFLYGKKSNKLDVSFCFSNYVIDQYSSSKNNQYKKIKTIFIPAVAYRYQKNMGGLMARIGLSAILNFNKVTNTYTPWIDVGLGWAF